MEDREEVLVTSQSGEIALEDGEIEEEEVIEPVLDNVCDEPNIIDTDNINNDSDVEINDRLTVKSKKHKHHKKSLHRKRQLSSDEISTTDSRKKHKSGEETLTPQNDNRAHSSDRDDSVVRNKSVEKCAWKHDSDNEEVHKGNSQVREDRGFVEDNNRCSPIGQVNNSPPNSPVIKEAWGADSDEDCSKPSENKSSNSGPSDWNNQNESKSSWGSKNDDENRYDNNNKGWGNRNEGNRGRGGRNEGNSSWNNRNDDDNKGYGNRSDDNKGWGNRNENNRGRGGRNDGNTSWNNRNENNNDWGKKNDDDGDDNKGWGNKNDDNNGFGGEDSGRGNRRGGRNNWGNDRNNRGGFRDRGRGNWRNKNDDNDSWGNRNRGNDDWKSRSKDNDDWGNKNKDGDDWSNKNKDNDDWSNKNKDNDDWGSKNKDKSDSGNNEETPTWKPSSDDKDNFVNKIDDVEEKQAWGHTSDDEDPTPSTRKESFAQEMAFKQSDENDRKESSVNVPPTQPREVDDFGKWGDFDSDEEPKKQAEQRPANKNTPVNDNQEISFDKPLNQGSPENCAKWNAYDSDDEANTTKPSTFKPQQRINNDDNNSSFNRNDSFKDSSPVKNSFTKWGNADSDDDTKNNSRDQNNDDDGNSNNRRGNFNNFGKKPFEQRNNRNDNFNNRNDNNNRGRGGGGGAGSGKRWPCKYFQMGSCRHGDNCTYIHESPGKNSEQKSYESKGYESKGYESKNYESKGYESKSHEPKIQELCRFYEHQECYKRNACSYMHEEFPCKLFHAGSKMCPSGDSCKYSHAPLNPETRSMLEKYLDEKIDERTDKSTSGSIHDNSDYKGNISGPCNDDMMSDPYFPDPMQRMYPQPQDPMKYPIRPWNPMMHYGEMPVPSQMDFMHRQRFMYERFPHPMSGRMMPRGFRGMMPNPGTVGPMHDPYGGNPYPITPLMPVYGNPKIHSDLKDPYIDNLAQIVVGKDSYGPKDPCMKREMMDLSMKREMMDLGMKREMMDLGMKRERMDLGMCGGGDDMDDFAPIIVDIKRNMLSPMKIHSPEIPPGAYVPRTSMNAVQPNVRLGSGQTPYGNHEQTAMMYGGGGAYAGHPGDTAMMDYINMAAIHYYHNQQDPSMNYDKPWKLFIIEVPVKIPYPLMNIDTQELPHKYTDPRLRGHPSVLNNNSAGAVRHSLSVTAEDLARPDNNHELRSCSSIGSQLSSPGATTTTTPYATTNNNAPDSTLDFERQMSNNMFQYRLTDQESPVFPLSEDAFTFLATTTTDDAAAKRVLDRSYLQDPRFKRKKVISSNNAGLEQGLGDME